MLKTLFFDIVNEDEMDLLGDASDIISMIIDSQLRKALVAIIRKLVVIVVRNFPEQCGWCTIREKFLNFSFSFLFVSI